MLFPYCNDLTISFPDPKNNPHEAAEPVLHALTLAFEGALGACKFPNTKTFGLWRGLHSPDDPMLKPVALTSKSL